MAELQWIIEVRCVNALLAQIKVGERGQHFIVEVPAGDFDPSEFEKLIEGVKTAKAIGNEHYLKPKGNTKTSIDTTQVPHDTRIIKKRELYDIRLLSTGELALVTIKNAFFAPSELDRFLGDLKKAKQEMDKLRETTKD
jgi:hypothetical protein